MSEAEGAESAGGWRGACRRPIAGAARAIALGGALALAACAALAPPADTFDLAAPDAFPDVRGSTRAQILIVEPSAVKTLDAQEIVVKPSPARVEYLARSQWSDRLPKLVQARLVEAFENTGRVRAVSKPGEGLVIDYQIVADIRAFQANVAADAAEISLSVKLVSDRTGKVIRTRIFEAQVPLASTAPGAVVDALNTAFGAIARDVIAWTFAAI